MKCCADNTRCSVSGSHEVEDLDRSQALAFLQRRGLEPKACHELVNHAGGRCIELVAAVESLHNGQSMEGVDPLTLLQLPASAKPSGWSRRCPVACGACSYRWLIWCKGLWPNVLICRALVSFKALRLEAMCMSSARASAQRPGTRLLHLLL